VCNGAGVGACGLGWRGGESSGHDLALSLDSTEADAVASTRAEEAMVCVTRGCMRGCGRGAEADARRGHRGVDALLRLSATVTSKFFPLYHFFPYFPPYFFISSSGSP
jgi:hypothetical protein